MQVTRWVGKETNRWYGFWDEEPKWDKRYEAFFDKDGAINIHSNHYKGCACKSELLDIAPHLQMRKVGQKCKIVIIRK